MSTNLTPQETAQRLRTTPGTLANWRVKGYGPKYLKFGRKVLYPLAEVEKFEAGVLVAATNARPAA